ncbi:MAG: sodium:solute symporter family protein [bacterium]|nr:sodium:solute symporter family protein [bacterium]
MVATFVLVYMLMMIPIGIYASKRVKSSQDFALAGRHLPFSMAMATVFATWFGSETFMGAGSRMAEGGFLSVIEDPFGAGLCLILIGFFFAKKLYARHNLTIGDYFHERYNKVVATMLSVAIILTYFGWVAAQFVALGIILNLLLGIPAITGMLIAAIIIVIYTYIGGMWAVSITDTVQMAVIVIGLIVILVEVLSQNGGVSSIIANTPSDFFRVTPSDATTKDWLAWVAAWMTIGLGSIPQQDVYQRVMSAKSAVIAKWASVSAGVLYFTIALIPLTLGLIARIKYPELVISDPQQLLPTLILDNTNMITQIFFFGALLSAIMSTASGALLAPATLLGENVIKPFYNNISDKTRLSIIRFSIIVVALGALALASSQGSIYELVSGAYSITLVSAFIPLVFGLYTHKANSLGALFAIILGAGGWQFTELYVTDPMVPATLVGLGLSFSGMLLGILLEKHIHKVTHHFRKTT